MTRPTLRRVVALTAATSLSVLLVELPALAAPGDLDTSFDGDGTVTTAVKASSDGQAGVAQAANGDVLVAGNQGNAAGTSNGFAVVEYRPAGGRDHNFGGGDGIATANFGDCSFAEGMAVDSQGRIVVAGFRRSPCNSADTRIVVARFQADGTLDPSFGGGSGKEVFALAGFGEQADAVAMDGDRIVLAGQVEPRFQHRSVFLLLRLNDDGHLDHTFSNDGFAFASLGLEGSRAFAVTVQSDHRAAACGTTTNSQGDERFGVARFTASGTLDTSFSSDGKATVNFSSGDDECTSIAQDGSGFVVGGMKNSTDCALAGLTSTGALDGSFGTGGRVSESLSTGQDEVFGLSVGGSGKVVATAVKDNFGHDRFAVLR
ncbi:MAG TPA: delta-60 repeat domain-containing protein, partial [Actinomycetota bacterium]|nr:delta-60 repeat domain-containing protein [Actinomycetota bacterium]